MRDLRRQNMAKNPLRDMFCLCKSEFRNVMYNCQLCRDWFHEDCVPVPSATNQNGILNGGGAGPGAGSNRPKWLCPSCVRSKRPRLETILPLLVQLQQLPIRLPEDEALRCLAERAMNWQDRARKALSSPDVSAAQEAILAQQQQQKRRSEGGGVGNINSPRKPRRRTSLSKDASGSTESDDADDDDDDDDCRLRIVEDGFSNDEEEHRTAATATNATAVTNTTNSDLLKLLSDSEIENLLDLMMEGDLLEVSLDETHELWRILETMPPTLLEAEAMERVAMHLQRQRQQPPPNPLATNSGAEDSNDSLLVQNSSPNSNSNSGGATASANNNNNNNGGRNKNKRRSNDASGNSAVPRKKQNTPKQTPGKKERVQQRDARVMPRRHRQQRLPRASLSPMPMRRTSRPMAATPTPIREQQLGEPRLQPLQALRTRSASASPQQPPPPTTTTTPTPTIATTTATQTVILPRQQQPPAATTRPVAVVRRSTPRDRSRRRKRTTRRSAGRRIATSPPDGRWTGCSATADATSGSTCTAWASYAARSRRTTTTSAFDAPKLWQWRLWAPGRGPRRHRRRRRASSGQRRSRRDRDVDRSRIDFRFFAVTADLCFTQ